MAAAAGERGMRYAGSADAAAGERGMRHAGSADAAAGEEGMRCAGSADAAAADKEIQIREETVVLPVLLTVTGKQTDPEGNTQENTAMYRAVLTEGTEGLLFSYRAQDEEVLLLVSREIAWMERGGNKSARMVFDPSVPSTQCAYMTAYGTIPMEIRTRNISVLSGGRRQRGDRDGSHYLQARIHYSLVMGQDYEQKCTVTIKAQQTG